MLGARSAVGGAGSTHAGKGQELTRGHIHSSTRVPGSVLGDAESHVGLLGGGDGRDPRHLRPGPRAGAGLGPRKTQGLQSPKEKSQEPAALGPWTPRGEYPKRPGGNTPTVYGQSLMRPRNTESSSSCTLLLRQ